MINKKGISPVVAVALLLVVAVIAVVGFQTWMCSQEYNKSEQCQTSNSKVEIKFEVKAPSTLDKHNVVEYKTYKIPSGNGEVTVMYIDGHKCFIYEKMEYGNSNSIAGGISCS